MERMKELVKKLNEAVGAYYNGEQEIMSNREYDMLYDELRALEAEFGVLPESPTQRVGEKATGRRLKLEHEHPALSLDKTKDVDELQKWLADKEGVLSWKMDGLTIVITFMDGRMVQAVTRGDGIVGEDITDNAACFFGIPAKIPFLGKIIVRAEGIIAYEEFERINEELPADAEHYKEPRSLASGTARLQNGIGDRIVESHVFELVEMEGGKPRYVKEQFELLRSWGFKIVDYVMVSSKNMKNEVHKLEKSINHNPFPSDGLVLTYDDSVYGESLGITGKYPRNSIAFKWEDKTYETVLRKIDWSASRTGLLNPVAVFEPVEVDGSTITRASLHNVSYVQKLGLGTGDHILVYKSNKIIPQLADNLTKSDTAVIPANCPICGGETKVLVRESDGREVRTLICTNPMCPAKHLGRFSRFVCKDAMNIIGISEKTLKKLSNMGFLHTLTDIYRLESHRAEIEVLEGFGKKSADNLFASIDVSKVVEPWSFLYALNIPNVGRDASKKILRFCGGKIEGFVEKIQNNESFLDVEDIGDITNQSIYEWKKYENNVNEMLELLKLIQFKLPKAAADTLKGKTIVITGKLETFKNRDEFIAFVEKNGGKAAGSVSANTAYLVNNDVNSVSSKNQKAKSLGVPIVSESEFKDIVQKS